MRTFARLLGAVVLAVAIAFSARAVTIFRVNAAQTGSPQDGASWATAYQTVTQAQTAAANLSGAAAEIWIAHGVYYPTTSNSPTVSFVLTSNVTLRGGFAGTEADPSQRAASGNQTVLSGDIGAHDSAGVTGNTSFSDLSTISVPDPAQSSVTDNCYNVLRAVQVSGVGLDRLTITGGYAFDPSVDQAALESILSPSSGPSGYISNLLPTVTGGGLFASVATVTITNCVFARNVARGPGGAIVARNSFISITGTTFVRNSAGQGGGGAAIQDCPLTFNGNTCYGNYSDHLGGALLIEDSTGSAQARALEGQTLFTMAGATYAAQNMPGLMSPDPKNPRSYYRLARRTASIGKVVATEILTDTGPFTGTTKLATQASKLISADAGTLVTSLSRGYTATSIAFAAVDIGSQIALLAGADPNSPFFAEWNKINSAFNNYCSPVGLVINLVKLILAADAPSPDHLDLATQARNADYQNNHNLVDQEWLTNNTFQLNSATGVGGAVAVFRANVAFGNSWFQQNDAAVGGGAAACFSHNDATFEDCAFIQNTSVLGHSALVFASLCVGRCVNDGFVGNQAGTASGRAVSVETGADLFIGNSVLWNNTAGPSNTVGADVFAARKADLDSDSATAYDNAGDAHFALVGTCQIRCSDVQSLGVLPLGNDLFEQGAYFDKPDGYELADGNPNVGEGIRTNVVSTGARNFSKDPLLLQNIFPVPYSPLVGAGGSDFSALDSNYIAVHEHYDLVGNPREVGPNYRVDVGPIESTGQFPPGTTLYVNSAATGTGSGFDWANAFADLPSALAASLPAGGQIWIAKGTYFPSNSHDPTAAPLLAPGVALIGGFAGGETSVTQSAPTANPTVISGAIGGAAGNSATLLDGTATSPDYFIYSATHWPRVIQGLTFTGATGAAVKLISPAIVQNCVFQTNGAGGRALVLTQDNAAVFPASVTIQNSQFIDNAGGAVDASFYNLSVLNSQFYGNTAANGAGLYLHGPKALSLEYTTIERSVFADNAATAGRGGAIDFEGPNLTIAQSVLADNTAAPTAGDTSTRGGAGLWVPPSAAYVDRYGLQVSMINSVFYGNRLTGAHVPAGTSVELQQLSVANRPLTLRSNDIEGLTTLAVPGDASGNIDYDPFFVSTTTDNFQLSPGSMLINRGAGYSLGSDSTPIVGTNDIGAYENPNFSSARPTLSITFAGRQPTAAGRTFTLSLNSPVVGMTNLVWQVKTPGGSFVPVTADAYTSGLGTSVLTFTNPPYNWSGRVYRLLLSNVDSLPSYSQTISAVFPPSILYVASGGAGTKDGTSWANAMSNPSPALAIAQSYTQIFVAGGTYPLGDAPLNAGVRFYGGFAGTETLASQRIAGVHPTTLQEAASSSAMLTGSGLATWPGSPPTPVPSIVDGFTVRWSQDLATVYGQPAVFQFGNGNTQLTNCGFLFSGAPESAVQVAGGSVQISGCLFGGGAETMVRLFQATAQVANCSFSNNGGNSVGYYHDAGAIATYGGGAVTVTDCSFTGNSGGSAGAIYSEVSDYEVPVAGGLTVDRCRFIGNSGGCGGVMVANPGTNHIGNCLFSGNHAIRSDEQEGSGGAIATTGHAALAIIQCTIVGNVGDFLGGAVGGELGGSYSLVNSVVWGNTSPSNYYGPSILTGSASITNSFVQDRASYQPMFDRASADYAPALGSPLINAGGSNLALSGSTDLEGNPRLTGGAVDLGAVEFQSASPQTVYARTAPADQTVFVGQAVSFTVDASLGSTTGSTSPVVWQYWSGGVWLPISGLPGWVVTTASGVSTLSNANPPLAANQLRLQAGLTATSPSVTFPAILTVNPRVILYVNGQVTASGNGRSWATAYKTIGEAIAASSPYTDIWVETGDYAENNLTPPVGANLFFGFGGTETLVSQANPAANPVRLGKPLANQTLVVDDVATLVAPVTLNAGATATWLVNRNDGQGFVNLAADANDVFTVVNRVPGIALKAVPAWSGYQYQVVVSQNGATSFTSQPITVTVTGRPTVYVDANVSGGAQTGADWANAFSTLSSALAAYPAFADLQVAQGTYSIAANTSFYLRRSLTLTGGYVAGTGTRDPLAHPSILSSGSGSGANASGTTLDTASNRGAVDSLTVVDGFTFANSALAVRLTGATPIVRNCTFQGVIAGISIGDASPTIQGCTFAGTLDTAVRVAGTASPVISRCRFQGNGAGISNLLGVLGGAITVGSSVGQASPNVTVSVSDTAFSGNLQAIGGAAIHVAPAATLNVDRCSFTGNIRGINATVGANVTVRDSLFAKNTHGAISNLQGNVAVYSSTIADNDSDPSRAAIDCSQAATVVANCILWNNTAGGRSGGDSYQFQADQGSTTISHSIIQGLNTIQGPALLPFLPLFVDEAGGNYQLTPNSPAIDFGLTSAVVPGETDLSGAARPQGAAPDLGAYEAATAAAPAYSFGFPTSLAAPDGSTFTLSFSPPAGTSLLWQFSTDGVTWNSMNPPSGPASNPPGVTQVQYPSLGTLTLAGIYDALNGVSFRATLQFGSASYSSPAVPVTILPFVPLYVDAGVAASGNGLTWGTAFKTLSEAIAAADTTHRIINVAQGTYAPTVGAPDNGTFNLVGLKVYGGWPAGGGAASDPTAHPAIFSGAAANGNPAAAVVVTIGAGGLFPTWLDGVTVSGGRTGIAVSNVSATLNHVTVVGATATGLVLSGSNSRPLVQDCTFQGNSGANGGAVHVMNGRPVFVRDTIRGNTASGNGGGFYLEDMNSKTQLISVLVAGNVATTGGGIYALDAQLELDQVTMAGNRAEAAGAVYSAGTNTTVLQDCLIWGNTANSGGADPELNAQYGAGYAFRNTNTVVGQTSLSNLQLAPFGATLGFDPVFVAPAAAAIAPTTAGDYHLDAASPAINAGSNSLVAGQTLDLDRNPRLLGTVDLGAYEFQGTPATPLQVTGQPAGLAYRRSGGGNAFSVSGTGFTSVQWQYAAPGGAFLSLQGVNGYSGSSTATLTVTAAPSSLTGYQFRAALTAADGSVVYSNPAALTVLVPQYYVNAGRAGTDPGDGLTWSTAFRSLDSIAALPYDPDGKTVWLAAGDYVPSHGSFVLYAGIALYGGFAGTETSLGQRNVAANAAAVLDGMGGSAPVVTVASPPAGSGSAGPATIDGISILNSTGYGIDNARNQDLVVNGATFSGLGTALHIYGGTNQVTQSVFTGNTVAISATPNNLAVVSCRFQGNGGPGGSPVVSCSQGSTQKIEYCLFAGNLTTPISGSGLTLENDTIVNNLGGTAFVTGGGDAMENSIVWGNRAADSAAIPTQVGSLVNSAGNVIEGVSSLTPLFVNPIPAAASPSIAGNYQLVGTSHVIGTGSNAFVTSLHTGLDLAGNPRLNASSVNVDPGCYEYQGNPYFVTAPANAVATTLTPAVFTVSGTAPVASYAWELSTDGGSSWSSLAEGGIYTGTSTAAMAVAAASADAGDQFRAQVQFAGGGPHVASSAARLDFVSAMATATGGYANPAVFVATASGLPTVFSWQVSQDGGANWSSVANGNGVTGAATAALAVLGSASSQADRYRVVVSYGPNLSVLSSSAAFAYADVTAAPALVARQGTLAYGSSSFGFTVPGGIQAASLTNSSLAVFSASGGRLPLSALATPVVNGSQVTLGFTGALAAGEQITVETTSALLRADGVSSRPQVWQFTNGVNSGAGVFAFANPIAGAAAGATAVASADLDHNGTIDLVVAGASGNQVYLNDGHGNFTPHGSPFGSANAVALALGGLTSAGGVGAAVVNADGSIGIWLNDGTGTFSLSQTITGLGAAAVGIADLNGDGNLDLLAAGSGGNNVLFGDGTGHFVAAAAFGNPVATGAGTSVALGDFNNDGQLDALVGCSGSSVLWMNQGGGVFTAAQTFASTPADRVAMGNFRGGALLDLVFTKAGRATQVWLNQGNGSFIPSPASYGGGSATLAMGDVNGDGRPDLVVTDATGSLGTWLGQTSGGFILAPNQPVLTSGGAATLADVDGDGALDLIGLDPSGRPSVALYRVVTSVGNEEAPIALTAAGFTRQGGAGLTQIKIASLPGIGSLYAGSPGAAPVAAVGNTFTLAQAAALQYQSAALQYGLDSFTFYGSSDGGSTYGPAAITYSLISVPVAHTFTAASHTIAVTEGLSATTLDGGSVTTVLTGNTNADAGTVTASVVQPPAHGNLTLHPDGTFTYQQDGSIVTADQFTYRAANGSTGFHADGVVTIAITLINHAPTALTFAPALITYAGQPAGAVVGTLAGTDPDPGDSANLIFTLVSGTGAADNPSFVVNGSHLQTAAPLSASGGATLSVRLQATDANGLSVQSAFTVTVVAPPAAAAASYTANEGSSIPVALAGTGGNGSLTFQIVSQPAHGTLSGTGALLTYVPSRYYRGSDSFTYTVSDGTLTSAPATISLSLLPVNNPPTLAAASLPNTTDKAATSVALQGFDPDGNPIQFAVSSQGKYGQATIAGSTLTYAPSPNAQFGVYYDSVIVYAYDQFSHFSNLVVVPVQITFVDTLVPDLSGIGPGGYLTAVNQTLTLAVQVAHFDGQSLTMKVGTAPLHGAVTFDANFAVTYHPDANFIGADAFTVYATDGTLSSAPQTITVNVTDPAPLASVDQLTLNEGGSLQIFLNGSDNGLGQTLTANIVTPPANGVISQPVRYSNAGFSAFYTPNAGFHGTDSLAFVMTDPEGVSSTAATISFTVNQVFAPPVAHAVTVNQNGLNPNLAILLSGTDPQNLPLTYRIVTLPTHGALSGAGPTVAYTASAAPFAGSDSFTYVVNDGQADSLPATVSLTFFNDNPPPSTHGTVATAYSGLGTVIDVLADDSDPWGNPLFLMSVSSPAHGTATITGTQIRYQNNGDGAVGDQFTYTFSNFSVVTTQTVFVTVSPRVLTVTTTNDSGPGSLREAIAIANQYATAQLAPDFNSLPSWVIQLTPLGSGPSLTYSYPVNTIGDSSATLGNSAFVILGTVTIRGLGGLAPVILQAFPSGTPLRLLHVAPGANLTVSGITFSGGSANQGGGIYNEGTLTLQNVGFSGNKAVQINGAPGLGGGLFNHNGTVSLNAVSFSGNAASDAAGLYNEGDGVGQAAHILATNATFSGEAPMTDFRTVAINGGTADWTAGSLAADTPTAPWFGPFPDTTVRSQFLLAVPVLLDRSQTLLWQLTDGTQSTSSVTGSGGTRTVAAQISNPAPQGVHPVQISAGGSGVRFIRNMNLTVDSGYTSVIVAGNVSLALAPDNSDTDLTPLLLANSYSPDGTPLTGVTILTNPSLGTISYQNGRPHFTAPFGATGSTTFTFSPGGGRVATATISFQATSADVITSADSGAGSLRAAVGLANTYPLQAWSIQPNAIDKPTVALSTAAETDLDVGASALVISGQVTIDGTSQAGFTLSAAGSATPMRLFHVLPGATLILRNLTLTGGTALMGGAIYNEGTVQLDGATIQANTATASGASGAAMGGAIYNAGGTVSLINGSLLTLNTATAGGGATPALGGAIYTLNGAVTITHSTISQNTANDAGGLYILGSGGTASITLNAAVLAQSNASSDLNDATVNGGHVLVQSTKSSIDRISGPWINPLSNQVMNSSQQLFFQANDSLAGVVIGASSENQSIVPNAGLTITAGLNGGHQLNVAGSQSGITNLHVSAAASGVQFDSIFQVTANTGTGTPPVANPASASVYPQGAVAIDALANDSDPNGLSFSLTDVGTPAHGLATISFDGKISYTYTDPNYFSTDQFTYTVADQFGLSSVGTVTITVLPTTVTVATEADLQNAIATAVNNPGPDWKINIGAAGAGQTWKPVGPFVYHNDGEYYTAVIVQGHLTIDGTQAPGLILTLPPPGFSGPPMRFFSVPQGASLTLENLTLNGGGPVQSFGAGGVGGAVRNLGILFASGVTFSNNSATTGNAMGGAVFNDGGTATLAQCVFNNNSASGSTSEGGAIASRNGVLTLSSVSFSGNAAAVGSNVYVLGDGAVAAVSVSGTNLGSYFQGTANGGSVSASGIIATMPTTLNQYGSQSVLVSVGSLLAGQSGHGLTLGGADSTSAKGAPITFSGGILTYAGNTSSSGSDAFNYTVQDTSGNTATITATVQFSATAPAAPAITTQPASQAVVAGGMAVFTAAASGVSAPILQWYENGHAIADGALPDGTLVSGSATVVLTLNGVGSAENGASFYLVATNGSGSATSSSAALQVGGILPPGTSATGAVFGSGYGYVAGQSVTITNTLIFTGTATSLGFSVVTPAGWSFQSVGGAAPPDSIPAANTTSLLDFTWSHPPLGPVTFTYTLNVPANQTGIAQISALGSIAENGGLPAQFLVMPSPLNVPQLLYYSADKDHSGSISLIELTRVIELYNTHNGSARTGAYLVQGGTEDGFNPDPARALNQTSTLSTYHSADQNRDGIISLLELTRVIELYNYRSGTARTGQFHLQAGTEDGFAPGP
jgi:hypothetical protein